MNRCMLESESNIVDQLKLLVGKKGIKLELDALQKSVEEYKISHILDTTKARVLTERAGAKWDEWESVWANFGTNAIK